MFTTDYDDILDHQAALEARERSCPKCGRIGFTKAWCPDCNWEPIGWS